METYCLKCRKHTKNIKPQISSTSNGKFNDDIKMCGV